MVVAAVVPGVAVVVVLWVVVAASVGLVGTVGMGASVVGAVRPARMTSAIRGLINAGLVSTPSTSSRETTPVPS